MGKFFDALRKSENFRERPTAGSTPNKIMTTPGKEVDALRIDARGSEKQEFIGQRFSGKIDPRLIALLEPQSPEAEIFKLLRAKIFCKDIVCRGRTIMVTSAQPLDGKSLVAANLAVTIAQGINEHVLLVDCDLRRPTQHNIFDLKVNQGLREYLEDGTSVAPFLTKTPLKKLTLLTAGRPPHNPSELLASDKMTSLIDEIRSRYQDRYVILDTTPAKFTPEISSLALKVDGILIVVRSGQTPVNLVSDVIENVGREKILGLVFNSSKESQKHYGHYYRYYRKNQPK